MHSAKVINQSRHLQLIPWLSYCAPRNRASAFPSMNLPRTGMQGMFDLKKAIIIVIIFVIIYYSLWYSPCDQTLLGCASFPSYTLKNTKHSSEVPNHPTPLQSALLAALVDLQHHLILP